MYTKLTDDRVKGLTRKIEEGCFIVSHVGDGEYVANVFGNIYSSYWQALSMARKYIGNTPIGVYGSEDDQEYFICYDRGTSTYGSYHTLPIIARLTREPLNSKFWPGA